MNSILPSLICAGILVIIAIVLLAVVLRLISRPASRTHAAPPPPEPAHPGAHANALIAPAPLPYARVPQLLTPAERDLFGVLQQALPPGAQLFAQVRLANLVQVLPRAKRDKTHWYRIQAKCVDFVLCAADSTPLLVIELDDRSHDRPDRRERDVFVDAVLAAAGLPILHIRWQRQYDAQALTHQLAAALGDAIPAPRAQPTQRPNPLLAAQSGPFWRPIAATAPQPPTAAAPAASRRTACGRCQAELRPQARFCSRCGATFTAP